VFCYNHVVNNSKTIFNTIIHSSRLIIANLSYLLIYIYIFRILFLITIDWFLEFFFVVTMLYSENQQIICIKNTQLILVHVTCRILAEIYLQFLEHYQILHLLLKQKTRSYHRYVDDILIIYDSSSTNINETLSNFNDFHHKIQFTIENEINNQINFLYLTISRSHFGNLGNIQTLI
jgi:hypothetical protein